VLLALLAAWIPDYLERHRARSHTADLRHSVDPHIDEALWLTCEEGGIRLSEVEWSTNQS
jgi:hypothetical protein